MLQSALAGGETISDGDEHLTLSLPVRARFRGGRADIHQPADPMPQPPRPDMALLKALARAHRWRQTLVDGEVASVDALARRVGQDRGHIGRTLNLAFLSPALTRAIVQGEHPPRAAAQLEVSRLEVETDGPRL
jgi:site-specific DNA recombinase